MIVVRLTAYDDRDRCMELAHFSGPNVLQCLWELQQSLTGVDVERMAQAVAKVFKRDGQDRT